MVGGVHLGIWEIKLGLPKRGWLRLGGRKEKRGKNFPTSFPLIRFGKKPLGTRGLWEGAFFKGKGPQKPREFPQGIWPRKGWAPREKVFFLKGIYSLLGFGPPVYPVKNPGNHQGVGGSSIGEIFLKGRGWGKGTHLGFKRGNLSLGKLKANPGYSFRGNIRGWWPLNL